jgi:hypothetical protein
MNRHEYPTFIDWWVANKAEYCALTDAQDGNPNTLADLIRSDGTLKTREAREFVADRLEGKKKQRGNKRTVAQQAKELGILGMIRDIQTELECSEYHALGIFLDRYPNECGNNKDTLRTYIRRAKTTLKAWVGREPPPVVQKRRNSEPE